MIRDLKLPVESCRFWWKEIKGERMVITKIKPDLDAVVMAVSVD